MKDFIPPTARLKSSC